jgi:methionyl-tRNA formyltransferase
VLELAPHGALNVHASLLPRHRGASPIQAAILAGDLETGVSIQRMVLALDEGDVLLERSTPIGSDESAGELLVRLAELGGEAACDALDRLAAGRATFTPQDPARATWARKIDKHDGDVDWTRDAASIERHVRAMTPWPGARALLDDGRGGTKDVVLLRVTRADTCSATPGAVLEAERRLVVATGDGALEVLELKPAGTPAMDGASFLRGARLAPGARFCPPPGAERA